MFPLARFVDPLCAYLRDCPRAGTRAHGAPSPTPTPRPAPLKLLQGGFTNFLKIPKPNHDLDVLVVN